MQRPKSANQKYDELIHAWKEDVDLASTDGGEVAELSHSTSEVMWAASSNGLDAVSIARPKTSNPGYRELADKAEGRRREGSLRSGDYGVASLSATATTWAASDSSTPHQSEVLWAEKGAPDAVHIARPGTSNPKRESLFNKGEPAHASECADGVLWSSHTNTGGVSPSLMARPHTRKPQLETGEDDAREWGGVGSPNALSGPAHSEILWSSDGGVEVELLARPHALNAQLSTVADRTPPRNASESSPSYVSEVLWSSEDASNHNNKGSTLDIESVDQCSLPSSSVQAGSRSPPSSRGGHQGQYQLRPFHPRPPRPAGAGSLSKYDNKLRKTFESLGVDAESDTISKANFCAFYSELEHFGAPVNALGACSKFKSAGSSNLTFDEFSCIMLKFQSR